MDGQNGICKKSLKRSSSDDKRISLKKRKICDGKPMRYTRPFEIGFYSPGTAPNRIPYHLYLLVKEAVDLMKKNSLDLTRVEKKVGFFCDFFHSHLPLGWKYDRDNATSLIAGCDAFYAKGGPKYDISGFVPLGDPVKNEFDYETQLPANHVFEIMSLVHSRKTPTPETFMQWDEIYISFYCKICSCFGIPYQHLEAASEDDVILMNMGRRRSENTASSANKPYKRRVEKISSNKDNYMFKHMRKLSSSDEAFELSRKEIRGIIRVVRSRRLPPQTTFTQWNEYQISFYCKMCLCFGVDNHLLEAEFSGLCL